MSEEYSIYKITYRINDPEGGGLRVGFAAGDGLTESQSFLEEEVKAEGREFHFVSIEKTRDKSPRKGIIFPMEND